MINKEAIKKEIVRCIKEKDHRREKIEHVMYSKGYNIVITVMALIGVVAEWNDAMKGVTSSIIAVACCIIFGA